MSMEKFRNDLIDGLIHREYQFTNPSMSADYFEKAKEKYFTDPLFRNRIECLVAGILHIMDKNNIGELQS